MARILRFLLASCVALGADAMQYWPFGDFPMGQLFEGHSEQEATVLHIKDQMTYHLDFTEWVLKGCSMKAAEARVDYLETCSLTSLLAAISSEGDQRSVSAAFTSLGNFEHEIALCNKTNNFSSVQLLGRVNGLIAELKLAQHHKWMIAQGQDPLGLYTVSAESSFAPPAGESPAKVSNWFLAKAASLDSVTQKAIDSKKGLNEAYLMTDRLLMSMVEAVMGFNLHKKGSLDPPELIRAKLIIESLQGHMTLLQAELAAYGAKVTVDDSNAPKVLAGPSANSEVQAITASLSYAVTFDSYSSTNCALNKAEADLAGLERSSLTSLLAAVSLQSDMKAVNVGLVKTTELLRILRGCEFFEGNLIARANEVLAELKAAAHHRWMVTNGQDPLGLYDITEGSKFAPVTGTPPDKQVEFFLGKVVGLDFFMHQAIDSSADLDSIYLASSRLQKTMQLLMNKISSARPDPIVDRSKSVIEALLGHVDRLQSLLRAYGVQPVEWVDAEPAQATGVVKAVVKKDLDEGILKYNISFDHFELKGCLKTDVEERLTEVENKSLVSLLAVVSFAGDPKTAGAARNATAELKHAMEVCNVSSWRGMLDRVTLVQSEIEAATRHRWMVANGKDTSGIYAVNPVLPSTFTPSTNKSAVEKADWFMAKVTIVDFLAHKAIDSNEGLDDAYALTRVLLVAIDAGRGSLGLHQSSTKADMEAARSMLLIEALEQHVVNLRLVLRDYGVVPPSATRPRP